MCVIIRSRRYHLFYRHYYIVQAHTRARTSAADSRDVDKSYTTIMLAGWLARAAETMRTKLGLDKGVGGGGVVKQRRGSEGENYGKRGKKRFLKRPYICIAAVNSSRVLPMHMTRV